MSKKAWEIYGLPTSMQDRSFLEIGCAKGSIVEEAKNRGATEAIGIDLVQETEWKDGKGTYYPMDVFSPGYLGLPMCDVVVCAGVLYHVHDPVGLLRRLHMKTRELLLLETAISQIQVAPMLEYCSGDSFDNNYSNWFLPNYSFLEKILDEVGFHILYKNRNPFGTRVWLHLEPFQRVSNKFLPRRKE
jgi:SAM-dependent methyltransferase